MTDYRALPLDDVPEAPQAWQRLVHACPDAWFWQTWTNLQFNFVAAQKSEARNLSFFVARDGEPVGIVPLMVNRISVGNVEGWEASCYGGPLPWPAFVSDLPDFDSAEQFALTELEKRAREAGAERIRLRLEPPLIAINEGERLKRAVTLGWLDSSYNSHWMRISRDTLGMVRERYQRYVKKFAPAYELTVVDGSDVTAELEETYFHLHVKDAGGQFRSRESYRYQVDLARVGEAFFVVAKKRANGVIAGMLLVSCYKKVAYDNSVAVDPDYQSEYVSHLLKWAAIEGLLRRGACGYELGPKSGFPSFMNLPTEKNRGISHFKEGWARDSVRKIAMAEKFLTARMLDAFLQVQGEALRQYFGITK